MRTKADFRDALRAAGVPFQARAKLTELTEIWRSHQSMGAARPDSSADV
jgi:hypothetical protein